MPRFSVVFVLLFSISIWGSESAKILAVFPMPSFSHFQLGFRIAKELADRGHQVTAINPYPQKEPIKNYRDVSVEDVVDAMEVMKKRLFGMQNMNLYDTYKFCFDIGYLVANHTYAHKNVQDLLKSDEKFDLLIIEHFVNDAFLGLAHHYKIPAILIGSHPAGTFNNYLFANPGPGSYVTNSFTPFTAHMSFFERVENFLYNLLNDVMRELYFIPGQREIFNRYIKTDVDFNDVLYNVSLMLINSHVSVTDAIPHVPNMIEIGGYHVKQPKKLPEDLQTFLDEAKEGVILFSMGSNLKSKDLKPEVRDALLKAFSKIKQRVLWKFETDLPNIPKNMKIMQWVPQQDVLRHPNVVAFISHGGGLSTIEAVYFGVPIIGIPVFGDQLTNIANAVLSGYAVSVPLTQLTEEKLTEALDEILNNPKYRENIKRRSRIMNDQPLKPIDSAMYWIEHVMRHQGAPHLRSTGLSLKWYQRQMVDVMGFLATVTIAVFVILYIIVRKVLGLCFAKKEKVSKSKKNK